MTAQQSKGKTSILLWSVYEHVKDERVRKQNTQWIMGEVLIARHVATDTWNSICMQFSQCSIHTGKIWDFIGKLKAATVTQTGQIHYSAYKVGNHFQAYTFSYIYSTHTLTVNSRLDLSQRVNLNNCTSLPSVMIPPKVTKLIQRSGKHLTSRTNTWDIFREIAFLKRLILTEWQHIISSEIYLVAVSVHFPIFLFGKGALTVASETSVSSPLCPSNTWPSRSSSIF